MSLNATDARRRDQLVRKRGAIKATLTSYKGLLDRLKENPDVYILKTHMGRLETAFTNLEEYTCELQDLESDTDHYAEQEALETKYANLLARSYRLQDRISRATAPSTSSTILQASTNLGSSQPVITRLPEQMLPKFDEKYKEWLSFQDDFQSTISRRAGLNGAEKLKYLRSCLSGEPERLVKQFETTDEGYHNAWALLKGMYEDKGRIRERYIYEVFNIPTMQRESGHDLSELINTLELHRSALTVKTHSAP